MKIMGRQENEEAGKKVRAGSLSRRAQRICCGAFHPYPPPFPAPPLPLPFFLPSCLPFSHSSLGKQQQQQRRLAGSPETTTTYSEKRQPVFHAVSPFCLPAATRPTRFFSAPTPIRLRPPDYRREKRLAEHENLKAQRPLRPPRGRGRCGEARRRREKKRFCAGKKTMQRTSIDVIPGAIGIISVGAWG